MPIETIIIDVHDSVFSASIGHVLTSGSLDVKVPKIEAERWLGKYVTLSSEREEEDESRPAKAPRHPRAAGDSKDAGDSDGDVGSGTSSAGKRRAPGRPRV